MDARDVMAANLFDQESDIIGQEKPFPEPGGRLLSRRWRRSGPVARGKRDKERPPSAEVSEATVLRRSTVVL